MLEELKTISQAGIRELLKERLDHPEKYVDKPQLIWRCDFRDGIQDRLVRGILRGKIGNIKDFFNYQDDGIRYKIIDEEKEIVDIVGDVVIRQDDIKDGELRIKI